LEHASKARHRLNSLRPGFQNIRFAGWAVLSPLMVKDMVWATIIALTAVSASNMLLWIWEAL
jgi:hypothetical protein